MSALGLPTCTTIIVVQYMITMMHVLPVQMTGRTIIMYRAILSTVVFLHSYLLTRQLLVRDTELLRVTCRLRICKASYPLAWKSQVDSIIHIILLNLRVYIQVPLDLVQPKVLEYMPTVTRGWSTERLCYME